MIKVPGSSVCFFLPLFPAFPAFFSSMIGSECTQLPPRSSDRPPQLLLLSRHSQALPLPQNSTFGCCCDPTSPGGCQDLSCPTERAPACASSLPIPDPPAQPQPRQGLARSYVQVLPLVTQPWQQNSGYHPLIVPGEQTGKKKNKSPFLWPRVHVLGSAPGTRAERCHRQDRAKAAATPILCFTSCFHHRLHITEPLAKTTSCWGSQGSRGGCWWHRGTSGGCW